MKDATNAQPLATGPAANSPCVRICVIHPHARLCTGCLRTVDEITRWRAMSPGERAAILEALPDRASRLRVRRGGRKGRAPGAG